jgi:phage terminase large subunit-like protein
LKKEYKDNPEKFKAEYGGEFLDASETYVKGLTIDECVDQDRGNVTTLTSSMIGHNYFWGLDLGMKHDATALAVCHWEGGQNKAWLVYDYIDRLMVGLGKYKDVAELPLDDVLDWLKDAHAMLPCFQGVTDQYGGSLLVQLLNANQVTGIELLHLTSGVNSQMYLTLKTLMENRQVKFPNVSAFVLEMKLLEASFINKYQVIVKAPTEKDAHDDMADAVALAAYKAQLWAIGDGKRVMWDIMQGVPQNMIPGTIRGGWDMNGSLAHLRSYERQLQHQLNPYGAVQNPWRRH